MAQREKIQPPVVPIERRQMERPAAATSGRCGFCGSRDTFSISPQSFQEWALERWGDAALLRCHDCGRRQAVAGLAAAMGVEWSLGRGLGKVMTWVLVVAGAASLLVFVLSKVEQAPPARLRHPKQPPPSPSAPAPSPPSGPFSLRSTPTNAA